MSDTPVTACWALAFWCAWQRPHDGGIGRALFAGVAAGAGVLTRPNLLPLAGPIALMVAMSSPRVSRQTTLARLVAFALALLTFIAALLMFQWRTYGSALESGYGSGAFASFFALSNVAPNIGAYARRLLIGEWPSLVLLLVATIVIAVRSTTGERQRSARPIALASVLVAVGVAGYLPYGVFADWDYLRFLLPVLPALFTIVGIAAAEATSRVPRAIAGTGLVLAAAAIVGANVAIAREQLAFDVRASEARYEFAARYVESALPRTAVVITSQHSVSVHDYSRLPIVRWDLASGLDAIVGDLETLGRRPMILVEEWERPLLARRFPVSAYAKLDWPPRADIGDAVRVYLYDPADRGRGHAYPTDRVH